MAKRLLKKRVAPKPVVAPKPRLLYRCIAENTVQVPAIEYSRRFGPGQIVDLEELIGGKVKLRDVIRPGTFRMIEPPISRTGGGEKR